MQPPKRLSAQLPQRFAEPLLARNPSRSPRLKQVHAHLGMRRLDLNPTPQAL
jgi:hypothetical protein